MGRTQYVKWCIGSGVAPDIYNVMYPHTYLVLWMQARRQAGIEGVLPYPEPEKGYLDQDAETMLAFECLEELMDARREQEEKLAKFREEAKKLWS